MTKWKGMEHKIPTRYAHLLENIVFFIIEKMTTLVVSAFISERPLNKLIDDFNLPLPL